MAVKDKARIAHILEAADDLTVFLNGKNRADLSSDKLLRYAVIRAIEIIGEASSQISAQIKADYPQLPWREAVGMRNELIHAYITVDEEIVWTTATVDIPQFVEAIKRAGLDSLAD
jgi:uncharacterized protein with HEPN domain